MAEIVDRKRNSNHYVDPGTFKSISKGCLSPRKSSLGPGAISNSRNARSTPGIFTFRSFNSLPSEIGESLTKHLRRTCAQFCVIGSPRRPNHRPRNQQVVNRNAALIPRGGCFFAPRNVSEASGSKRTPRVKRYVPSTNGTIYRGVTCFLMVMMKMCMFVSGYRYGYLVAGYTDRDRKSLRWDDACLSTTLCAGARSPIPVQGVAYNPIPTCKSQARFLHRHSYLLPTLNRAIRYNRSKLSEFGTGFWQILKTIEKLKKCHSICESNPWAEEEKNKVTSNFKELFQLPWPNPPKRGSTYLPFVGLDKVSNTIISMEVFKRSAQIGK
ncbi:hypothetical protein PCH_Pc24g01140 [Penicillium rubens Wisconsin 54-1255]|uniref:Uncharacterized protein n=1 Tax=Penicillium rubens (strain ATCC 28089 / DSM 1075 / NRRL 1951 / Wisconsin 54-1255) TaxID=500485 RepID=B6HWG3_PENRW|nr:hypothetical protein PCH_Pc24g01140 [Penicillium rubens Wisconsin 54-1255]